MNHKSHIFIKWNLSNLWPLEVGNHQHRVSHPSLIQSPKPVLNDLLSLSLEFRQGWMPVALCCFPLWGIIFSSKLRDVVEIVLPLLWMQLRVWWDMNLLVGDGGTAEDLDLPKASHLVLTKPFQAQEIALQSLPILLQLQSKLSQLQLFRAHSSQINELWLRDERNLEVGLHTLCAIPGDYTPRLAVGLARRLELDIDLDCLEEDFCVCWIILHSLSWISPCGPWPPLQQCGVAIQASIIDSTTFCISFCPNFSFLARLPQDVIDDENWEQRWSMAAFNTIMQVELFDISIW